MSALVRQRGVTVIELTVVLAIIAILLAILLPAIHHSREAARRTACQSNLHQLGIALKHFVDVRKKLPDPGKDGTIGGWAIAILPFMDDANLADGLAVNSPLDPLSLSPLACQRPFIMTCPSAYSGDSSIETVPASHYSASLRREGQHKNRMEWQIGEVPVASRIPWVISPETPFWERQESGGPHAGGYYMISGYGPAAHGTTFIGAN